MVAVILLDMETTNNTTPDRVLTTVWTDPRGGFRIVVTRCYYNSDSHTVKSYRCRTLAGARKFELECHAEAAA